MTTVIRIQTQITQRNTSTMVQKTFRRDRTLTKLLVAFSS